MCVFLSLRADKAKIEKQYDATYLEEEFFGPTYFQSAYEFPKWPVITSEAPGRIQNLQWGFVPAWAKDPEQAKKLRFNTVNARAETLYEKPSFRQAARSRHCLVLADGFFEYQEVNGKKYPYFIRLKENRLFSMAGVYDSWVDPETGEILPTFSIVTTEANPLMEQIHNRRKRMPVILSQEQEPEWLDVNRRDSEIFKPFNEKEMEAWPVGRYLTDRSTPKSDPLAIEKFEYPELRGESPRLF